MALWKVKASWKNETQLANLSSIIETKWHNHAFDRHKHKNNQKA
jgi:hypothetical protein